MLYYYFLFCSKSFRNRDKNHDFLVVSDTMVDHCDRLPRFPRWGWVTLQTADTVAALLVGFCLLSFLTVLLFLVWREVLLSDTELSLPEEAPGLGVHLGSGI